MELLVEQRELLRRFSKRVRLPLELLLVTKPLGDVAGDDRVGPPRRAVEAGDRCLERKRRTVGTTRRQRMRRLRGRPRLRQRRGVAETGEPAVSHSTWEKARDV